MSDLSQRWAAARRLAYRKRLGPQKAADLKRATARIVELRKKGASDDAIAKRLMHEGFKTATGLSVWQVSTVWKLRKAHEKIIRGV